MSNSSKLDAIVIGRAGMDLYASPENTSIDHAKSFSTDLGGSAANIAVAMAKQGSKVGLLTLLSDDAVGAFVENKLKSFSVEAITTNVATKKANSVDARTSLALAEVKSDNPHVVIYRNQASDFFLQREDVDNAHLKRARCLVITGTALAKEPSRSSVFYALECAKKLDLFTVFDLDYRKYSWASQEETKTVYQRVMPLVDAAIGNDEEFALVDIKNSDVKNPSCRDFFLKNDRGRILLYKMGAKGCTSLFLDKGEIKSFDTPVFKVTAKKPYGAGDAFLGNVLSFILKSDNLKNISQETLSQAVQYGAAAAAWVVSHIGCASAMPNTSELNDFIKNNKNNS